MKDMISVFDQITLPVGLRLGVSKPMDPSHLFPAEAEAMRQAVPRRQAEFAGGRVAARTAMGQDLALPVSADRTPIWPAGVTGSISHTDDMCIAIAGASTRFAAVGIDLEPNVALPPELVREVLTPQESAAALKAKQVFSAKEAVFKAHFMLVRKMYGFQAMAVSLETGRAQFRETSETRGWPDAHKQDLQFQQWVDDRYILSLCIIPTAAGGDDV